MSLFVELCCADLRSVEMAARYPVDGIEFCVDLTSGGLTPSISGIRRARKIFGGELSVMVRHRKGDFLYDDTDKHILLEDIRQAIDAGADAIVFGALDEDGLPDRNFIEKVIQASGGCTLCFHKVIDISNDILQSLDLLMEYQIDRVLSGGGAPTALAGSKMLHDMVQRSAGRIQVMAGGSIDSGNVLPLLEQSGVDRIHGAFMVREQGPLPEYGFREITTEDRLSGLMAILGRI